MSETPGQFPPPPTPYGGVPPSQPPATSGGGMAGRHLVSVLIAVIVTPVGLALFDLGVTRWFQYAAQMLDPESAPLLSYVFAVAGCVLLLVAAAAGRVSGLGPVAAGILWGVVPGLWVLVDVQSFWEVTRELPEVWDHPFWFGYAPFMLPLAGVLLVGAGVAGRWSVPRSG
jgi:hypothetical protein